MEKRKKLFVIAILALVAAILIAGAMLIRRQGEPPVTHTPPQVQRQAQNIPQIVERLTPADTVVGLLRALREWNMASAAQWSTPAEGTIFSDAYRGVLVPVITRIEFDTRVERIDGSTAIVDVSVYAVDLRTALGDLSENAANYLLHRELEEGDPDWVAFLSEHMSRLEDVDSLIRMRRTAPAHLVMDGNGSWLFEAGNPDNTNFYNAVSGGLPELIATLSQVQVAAE